MIKTIILTGGTDGIGFEAAKLFVAEGHTLLLHGRSAQKLEHAKDELSKLPGHGDIHIYRADLSKLAEVEALVETVTKDHAHLDVLINNAGVFKVPDPLTAEGYDVRFIVNLVAPYLLTKGLLPLLKSNARVINLSSAAQAPVDIAVLTEKRTLGDSEAYAQSKLGITMWSFDLAQSLGSSGPSIVAVNPASFLGSKMVKEAYGTTGHDLSIGAEILFKAALSKEFAEATGRYFDNDRKAFANPHPDVFDASKNRALIDAIEWVISNLRAQRAT